MFTGLIEAVGEVSELTSGAAGFRLRVRTPLAGQLHPGDSVAVNGVCLTVTTSDAATIGADIGPETARVTTLGGLRRGVSVNLERSMSADGRFGGHFVLGHVDGTGRVALIRQDGESRWLTVSIASALEPLLILKGSVAVDGVSLTVARLGEGTFEVMIIPFTWGHTSLASLRVGDPVNLECDMIGKYVVRSMDLAARGRQAT